MPLYEYECQHCQRRTEKRQKFSDPEITHCPHCGGHLQRVISAPAIAFKGGGWYADGYGNAKPKSTGEGKPSGEAKADSSSESSAKPASAESTGASTPAPAPAPSAPTPSSVPASAPTKN